MMEYYCMKRNEIKSSAELFLYKGSSDFHVAEVLWIQMENGDLDIEPETIK